MRIVIAGGSGFLGATLSRALTADGNDVVILTRSVPAGSSAGGGPGRSEVSRVGWIPDGSVGSWKTAIEGADVAVNLAGESIAGIRWTKAKKARIRHSRMLATRSLVAAIGGATRPPALFISGSAVGYYGPRDDEVLTEAAPPGEDFLAYVCREWEEEASGAASDVTRVVVIRTGLVLAATGGVLPRMALPFRLFAGGPLGSGRQYVPWIHLTDWVGLVRFAALNTRVDGPLNATAPTPVTNREFSRALGRTLHRPSFLPAPAFAIRLMLGEMGDGLLLSGQRAVPAKATELGFQFQYSEIEAALKALLS